MNWIGIVAGIVAGAAVAYFVVEPIAYTSGRTFGQNEMREEFTRLRAEAIQERNETNEKVDSMSAADLCQQLGGVWESDTCK